MGKKKVASGRRKCACRQHHFSPATPGPVPQIIPGGETRNLAPDNHHIMYRGLPDGRSVTFPPRRRGGH